MKVCLIGRQGSGRETIFRALTALGPAVGQQELRQGETKVSDPRLDYLSGIFQPRKHTPARLELLLPKPQAEPQKALKASLEKARDCDVLLLVLKNFSDASEDKPDPAKEAALMIAELKAIDFVTLSGRLEKLEEDHKRGRKADPNERLLLTQALKQLEDDKPLREIPEVAADPKLRGFGLLSAKPMLALLNEPDNAGPPPALELEVPCLAIKGSLEMEFSALEPEEAKELMGEYGLVELVGDRIAKTLYDLTGVISFFTVGDDECRAWTISRGDDALTAAGVIHSDIQKGFIRAEVVAFEDFKNCGSFNEAKKRGLFRLESKTYQVADGDIVHFRFNI
ncbi:MAG: DUF933 domain-containing protein [Deltaproteobacteria bacterium]|nr:DUF933 domain-containing protein [Deltaproteobacteria bacterium]